ncbi:unnamed protein product [Adineta ricciae]|uniref:Uncharacterized protein n=1 Tax=Adineta ricciae TaxID=249248 RepID=A0A814AGD7_ADIRI|nr:unnamed protein product [Adineta ricciae]CAF0911803.1 unnamed protein product [Adineta ricciae]
MCQFVQSQVAAGNSGDRTKKQLEEIEENNESRQEKELAKLYSSSKANAFLTYDKCMQRMKCPANRKEECSEECTAGNTEEEIEEHSELTKDERRSSMNRAPKRKYEPTKHSSKSKPTPVNDQSNAKTDL